MAIYGITFTYTSKWPPSLLSRPLASNTVDKQSLQLAGNIHNTSHNIDMCHTHCEVAHTDMYCNVVC